MTRPLHENAGLELVSVLHPPHVPGIIYQWEDEETCTWDSMRFPRVSEQGPHITCHFLDLWVIEEKHGRKVT